MSQTSDQRHQTMVLQELSEVDTTLAKYLGCNHPIRKDLGRLIKDLKERLAREYGVKLAS